MDQIVGPTKTWHSVRYNVDTNPRENYFVMREWIDNCTFGQCFIMSMDDIRFKDERDAIAFSLRWS